MANTEFPPILTDGAVDKLIREALETPAEQTHPHLDGTRTGCVPFDADGEVHVIASRFVDAGQGPRAQALCGSELNNLAYGLFSVRPMCWLCADLLDA